MRSRYKRADRLRRVMRQYSVDSGTVAVFRPVEIIVLLRMMTPSEEEREALIWALSGTSSLGRL